MNEKIISKKLLLKSSFWYTVSSFLARAMVFITMPIFTRLMTKEEYGDFSVFASWQAILLIICGIEIYSTLNRARFDYPEGALDSYISSSLTLSTLFTAIVFGLYLIFPRMFDRFFLLERRYMYIMFAYLFLNPSFAMFQAKQRIQYRYKLSAVLSFSVSILSAVLSVLLATMMTSDRLLGRILGQYSLPIVVGAVFYVLFLAKNSRISLSAWKYALRLGVPMVFGYLGGQLMLSSDALVVKHLGTATEVSYLSVTHTCSHIIMLLVQALNGAWAPWFYDMLKLGENLSIRKTFRVFLWLVIICTFGVLLVGPEIILILGGYAYMESLDLLPAYILCGVFSVLTSQFSNLETYHKKPEYAGILTIGTAVLNIVLDIVGVRLWGYRAVCYATLLCQLILIGLHYCVTQKMNIREILPFRDMAIALLASLALIPTALLLYQSNLVRYICIGVLAVALVICLIMKRKELKKLIQKFKSAY